MTGGSQLQVAKDLPSTVPSALLGSSHMSEHPKTGRGASLKVRVAQEKVGQVQGGKAGLVTRMVYLDFSLMGFRIPWKQVSGGPGSVPSTMWWFTVLQFSSGTSSEYILLFQRIPNSVPVPTVCVCAQKPQPAECYSRGGKKEIQFNTTQPVLVQTQSLTPNRHSKGHGMLVEFSCPRSSFQITT